VEAADIQHQVKGPRNPEITESGNVSSYEYGIQTVCVRPLSCASNGGRHEIDARCLPTVPR